jgi:hypothetical protein
MRFFGDADRGLRNATESVAHQPTKRWRPGPVRAVVPAAALVGLALLLGGCGGGKPDASVASLGSTATTATTPAGTSSAGTTTSESSSQSSAGGPSGGRFALADGGSVAQLTKYSACMRRNGVPSFPDPNAQGQISFSSGNGVDPGSAPFQQAQQVCQKLLPNGGQPTPAEQAQARTQALAFSACMRSHGVPSFPDPQFGSGGRVSIRINQASGIDPGSPQFQAAQKACQEDVPGSPGAGPPVGTGAKTSVGGSSG